MVHVPGERRERPGMLLDEPTSILHHQLPPHTLMSHKETSKHHLCHPHHQPFWQWGFLSIAYQM